VRKKECYISGFSKCIWFSATVVVVLNLIRAYFKDIRLCLSTAGFITGWQRLEIDIMAGYTFSPLAFTMAMEIIIR